MTVLAALEHFFNSVSSSWLDNVGFCLFPSSLSNDNKYTDYTENIVFNSHVDGLRVSHDVPGFLKLIVYVHVDVQTSNGLLVNQSEKTKMLFFKLLIF